MFLLQRTFKHRAVLNTLCRSFATSHGGEKEVQHRKQLVLLGCGWGSYSVLKHINKKYYDVIVVSPRNHFLFTPLLASTTVGTLEFRSIIEPVRNTSFRRDSHFQLSQAVDLRQDDNVLVCEGVVDQKRYEIKYDKLVIGVGAQSNTFGVPGVFEHGYFIKEIHHARRIRSKIIDNFELSLYPFLTAEERKRLLHFVIVGGGPTGVEFGAELYDFITQDVSRLYAQEKDDVAVTLIEADEILPLFDVQLRQFAMKKMKQRKNYNMVKGIVVEVGKDFVKLKDGRTLQCGMTVWSTGLAPRPFTAKLQLPKSKSQQLLVDPYLKVKGVNGENVYAIGDCCQIEENPHPCTAQVAERQGKYLARTLNAVESDTNVTPRPFTWKNMGMLAYIGNYNALADLPGPHGKLTGFKTWILWRCAYMTTLGSWRLRMQVPFDWARTFFFGRDTSRF